jgi:hypothetical protein
VGNCAFFEAKSFTYDIDPCRVLGNTLEVVYTGGEQISIVNSTFYGQGDGLVSGGLREGDSCEGTETLTGRNNVFLGDTDYFDPGDITFLFYQEGCVDKVRLGVTTQTPSSLSERPPRDWSRGFSRRKGGNFRQNRLKPRLRNASPTN